MDFEELFGDIADKAVKINRYWQNNNLSSKAIRTEIERDFYKEDCDFIDKFAYYYALKKRIKVRYGNIFKKLFGFFQWKKETALLFKIKKSLKFPERSAWRAIADQKSKNMPENKDFSDGGDDGDNKSERRKKTKNKTIINAEKDRNADKKVADGSIDDLADEIKREAAAEYENSVAENEEEVIAPINSRNVARDNPTEQKTLNDGVISGGERNAVGSTGIRERIVIPEEDLLKSNKKKDADNRSVVGNERVKSDIKDFTPSPKATDAQPKPYERAGNDVANVFLQDLKLASREQNDKAFVPDVNPDARQENNVKSQDRSNTYYDKRSQSDRTENFTTYERHKSEIAAEELAKLTEEDVIAIKEVMQEEIDRQMSVAEEKGEIYKMPIGIKEAIAHTTDEKSEVQTIKADSAIADNKK